MCRPLITPDNRWHKTTWPEFQPSLPPGLRGQRCYPWLLSLLRRSGVQCCVACAPYGVRGVDPRMSRRGNHCGPQGRDCPWCHVAARTIRRAHLLTLVTPCGHQLPVESFEEPLAARVACRAGRAAAHHGGRAAGWTQAWHRTCVSLLHRENRKHAVAACVVALTTGSGRPPLHGGSSTHGTVPDRGCGTVKKWGAMHDDYGPWGLFGLDDAVRRHGGVSVV